MPRLGKQHRGGRDLDQVPGVHHAHPIRDLGEHAEVVGHVEHRHAEPGAQIREQLDDLLLRGDVEPGRGLVENEQVGRARERHGDRHPLLLAP